ncbi:MAG: molybdopterin molybdotransferase MoeA [Actinobacteria bacterium]|nr:molybdopterin molybdotransferase MoeA [Actinomycetota bacterium]
MIPLEEARAHVLAHCPALASRAVALAEAVGCVSAAPVIAGLAVPAFRNAAVDGFAVRAADVATAAEANPARLRVVATVAAGATFTGSLGAGETVRIMTGAPVPDGADAVVMVERSRSSGPDHVELTARAAPHDGVRDAGDDIRAGDTVVPAGTVLTAAHLGVLASIGRADVDVVPRPVVGVLSTGDELVAPGQFLRPGQIHDSNRAVLAALLASTGCTVVDLGLIRDDEEAVATALTEGAARCDALVSSGGVSMGDFDVIKLVLDKVADMRWMQIAMRPAKPFAFGVLTSPSRAVPVFGLPGNPVSSLVSFELLARPGLRRMAGHERLDRPRVRAVLEAALPRRVDGKLHLPRVSVRFDGTAFRAAPVSAQGSHQMAATAGANALALLPDGDGLLAGEEVEVLLLDADSALGGS